MGFETPEDAERWAENMEFRADQRREERMSDTPRTDAFLNEALNDGRFRPSPDDWQRFARQLERELAEAQMRADLNSAAGSFMAAMGEQSHGPNSEAKDAARYRWLRDHGADTIIMKNQVSFDSGGSLIHVKQIGWTELDKAIDAAMPCNATSNGLE